MRSPASMATSLLGGGALEGHWDGLDCQMAEVSTAPGAPGPLAPQNPCNWPVPASIEAVTGFFGSDEEYTSLLRMRWRYDFVARHQMYVLARAMFVPGRRDRPEIVGPYRGAAIKIMKRIWQHDKRQPG